MILVNQSFGQCEIRLDPGHQEIVIPTGAAVGDDLLDELAAAGKIRGLADDVKYFHLNPG
jgi:hypothetical protein